MLQARTSAGRALTTPSLPHPITGLGWQDESPRVCHTSWQAGGFLAAAPGGVDVLRAGYRYSVSGLLARLLAVQCPHLAGS